MTSPIPEIKNLPELLQPLLPDGSRYLRHTAKLLNAPGENYGSLMLALDITINENGKEKMLNTVAKLSPPNEWIRRMFATDVTFKKEVKFYLEIAPTLLKFQIENNVPEDRRIDIFPNCLGARLNLNGTENVDEDCILLLENLKTKQYSSGDRMIGLNLEEAEIALKNLAKFHAVPLAYKILCANDFEKKLMPFLDKINIGQEMFDEVSHRFIESIIRHLNLTENELVRFESGMRKGFEFQEHFPPGNEKFATTVHRDFWVNNTMTYKENNIPIKNKIVDFQVITIGSPFSDLVFFLYTSVIQSVLIEHYDHFIKVYHNSFIECLRDLQCDTSEYTLESFKNEINIYGPLEMSHIVIMFKAVFADSSAVKEMEDFGIEEMFSDNGLTDIYKNKLKWTVRHFLDKNWI